MKKPQLQFIIKDKRNFLFHREFTTSLSSSIVKSKVSFIFDDKPQRGCIAGSEIFFEIFFFEIKDFKKDDKKVAYIQTISQQRWVGEISKCTLLLLQPHLGPGDSSSVPLK